MENLYRSSKEESLKQNIYKSDTWECEYLTFDLLSRFSDIKHLFTTRRGGVSKGEFATMNLSFTRGDNRDDVMENYRRVAAIMGTTQDKMVCSDQTHTTNVRVVSKQDAGKGVTILKDYTDVDGLITKERGIVLSTFYADCVPLYFFDPVKKAIGLSHSGWRGTVSGMGEVTVLKMQAEFGCDPSDIYCAIGPSICRECYEVSQMVYDEFLLHSPVRDLVDEVFYTKNEEKKSQGKYQMDLWKANELVLLHAGIKKEHIAITDLCTAHNPDYLFSHRITNGKRGNLGAFLMLK